MLRSRADANRDSKWFHLSVGAALTIVNTGSRADSNGRRNIVFSCSKILIQGLGGSPPSQSFSWS